MSPQVTAAIIAVGGVVLTVIATVAVQISGRRATSRDTQAALEEQRKQLDRTLAEQRKQLDKTLAEQRTRTLNERFAAAAGQLGRDKPPEVRLAGVYAMAGLADDWPKNRQTCVDVLCGYLRMPYEPDPGDGAPGPERLAFRSSREVRHTVIRLIGAHLRHRAAVSWQNLNFDFTGVVFDGGDFTDARFSGGIVQFTDAEFSGGRVDFGGAEFSGGRVDFSRAEFSGGRVDFSRARFSGGAVDFSRARFSGGAVDFNLAEFSGGRVGFSRARFSGGAVEFNLAEFSGSRVDFRRAEFSGGRVGFGDAGFSRGQVDFSRAGFSGGRVGFGGAEFSGGRVDFGDAGFSGSWVAFGRAGFSGGKVDFSGVSDWSSPPVFPWTDRPPPGVELPKKEEQSQT